MDFLPVHYQDSNDHQVFFFYALWYTVFTVFKDDPILIEVARRFWRLELSLLNFVVEDLKDVVVVLVF